MNTVPIHEKIEFLMETIPSEERVNALKRHYLLGGTETALLLDASKTLHSAEPDRHLVEWAYALLQVYMEKERSPEKGGPTLQTKIERILALFSNAKDLHRALERETWSPSETRAFQLISHFVNNDIPLVSNTKMVEKVHDLLENSYLPPDIAARYFGKSGFASEKNLVLEKYRAFLEEKKKAPKAVPEPKKEESGLKRFSFILGAAAIVAIIFLSGFFTAKTMYERSIAVVKIPMSPLPNVVSSREKEEKKEERRQENENLSPPEKRVDSEERVPLRETYSTNRELLQKGLERYGLQDKIDFATHLIAQAAATVPIPDLGMKKENDTLRNKGSASGGQALYKLPTGPIRVAIESLAELQGLKLPLPASDRNGTKILPYPKNFTLKAKDSPSSRIVYLTDGTTYYPKELYSFIGEPVIMEYRLIGFKRRHFIPVPSHIWQFSERGELRMHKHFIYQGERLSPAKIITTHFLPNGATMELVSIGKLDRDGQGRELLVERKDYLPSGKFLYRESREVIRKGGKWTSRIEEQIWYDEGKKIHIKNRKGEE
ncbi:hypothetical protein [Hydrogenimonas sp.]